MASSDSSTLQTNYTSTSIGQAALTARASEFPKEAIDDAILNACDAIIFLIGNDRKSQYRKFFHDVTASIASGAVIPIIGSTAVPVIGKLGTVRDASDSSKMKFRAYGDVKLTLSLNSSTLTRPKIFFTDNVRIWHTVSNVTIDVVVYSKAAQRILMAATPRGACPFPEDLADCIVYGALSLLFKGGLNNEQARQWREEFFTSLKQRFGESQVNELEQREILE